MAQYERGGQNVQRWPAELPETDNPEGTVGEELRDADERDHADRMAALPAHEQDPDHIVGGGIMSMGGTATDHGRSSDQPVPEEEGDQRGESGLPMGDTPEQG